jgi:hypothetical protein
MSGESGGMSRTAAFAALAAFACLVAAEPALAAERTFSITSFDRIRIDGPYRVKLTTSVAPFARVTGSSAAIDRVSVEVQGRTLVVHTSQSSWGGYPGQPVGPVEIAVGTHELTSAYLNGAGSLAIDRVKGLSFELYVQGSGSAAIGDMAVDQLKLGMSGAGSASVAGSAAKVTAVVRGTSSLDASALAVKDGTLAAEGSAVIKANVSNSAKIDARGTAAVEIAGRPACTIKAEGSATVAGCS